jgi:hypothetical protein
MNPHMSGSQFLNAPGARLAAGLTALSDSATYSVVAGSTHAKVRESRPVDDYVMQGRPARRVHRQGMLNSTHAVVNNTSGEVFHPDDVENRIPSESEALSRAKIDGVDGYLRAYPHRDTSAA